MNVDKTMEKKLEKMGKKKKNYNFSGFLHFLVRRIILLLFVIRNDEERSRRCDEEKELKEFIIFSKDCFFLYLFPISILPLLI